MQLEFDDYRPDVPRLPSAISWREGVLLSFVFHLLLVLTYVLLPSRLFRPPPDQALVQPDQVVQFVTINPLVDKSAPPKKPAVMSDIDRRSTTREQVPKPDNEAPLARGNTPEKVEGAPKERAAGPESPTPQPPSPSTTSPPPDVPSKVPSEIPVLARPAGGGLGDSLRNLQRYLKDDNYDNQRGGQTDRDPDIQFDSKGVEFGPWIRRFIAQVKHNWLVPEAAYLLKGHVILQFNVQKNGTITDLRVVEASSINAFNIAALNAMRMSNPTLALPPEYPTEQATFTVTFHYNEPIRD
jgi:TonB family protein